MYSKFFRNNCLRYFRLRKKNGRKSPEVFKSLLNSIQKCLYKRAISINSKEQPAMKTIRITTVIKIQNIFSIIYFVAVFGKKPPTTNRSSKPINKNSLLLRKVIDTRTPKFPIQIFALALGKFPDSSSPPVRYV